MNIGKLSFEYTVLINIAFVVLLLLGTFSVFRLPQEQFSEVPFFWVNISVPYPGASAEDIEQSVTIPIENEYTGMDKVKQISSSTAEGLSLVRIEFDDGISNDEFARLYQEVQSRFSNISLPEGTLDPFIKDFSATDFLPVIEVIVTGEGDFFSLSQNAKRLRDRLGRIADVSRIELVGERDRRILVELDRERLEALGVSVSEVSQALQAQNVTIPGGTLETGVREYLIRTVGSLQSAEEFRRVVVRRPDPTGGGLITVGDLAEVNDGYADEGALARFNGRPSLSLRVNKQPRGNSVGIIEDVKDIVAEFEQGLPPGYEINLFGDSTIQIKDSLNVLISNSLMGLVLLVLILLLFIGLRNALITAMGIPLTFAVTFLILEALGETLNSNTLFGLVLVLGLIVDHSIVIIENSFRYQQMGYSRMKAAVLGTNEVAIPVIAATATTVAAFLPLMLLPGIIGKFLRVIPLTVTIALVVSTLEALIFLPAHFAEWAPKLKKKLLPGLRHADGSLPTEAEMLAAEAQAAEEEEALESQGQKVKHVPGASSRFHHFQKGFERLLTKLYGKRRWVLVGIFVIMIGVFSLAPFIRQDLFSAEDFTLFYIDIEMPVGTPRDRTDAVVREFEQRILPLRGNGEVVSVNSYIGFTATGVSNLVRVNVAQLVVDLTETNEGRTRPILTVLQEVQELTQDIAGPETVRFRKAQTGPPTSPPVGYRLRGDNYNDLALASNLIQNRLADYPVLYNIQDDLEAGTPELRVQVDNNRASRYGLSALQVGSFIRSSLDGQRVSTIFRNNEEVEVRLRYGNLDRRDIESLYQLRIPTPDGRLIPFSTIATIEQGSSLASIRRVEGKREVSLQAEAFDNSGVREINSDIREYFRTQIQPVYPGIELVVGGEFADLANLLLDIARIFLLGVFLIYAILGAQFKSYGQPGLILFSIPFAFVGVIAFLVMSGTPFSTTVLYAGVALAGIAVNDSIVLISFINELRLGGMETGQAVIKAAGTRLRPIILTSVTTIAGLLPTALGLGGSSVVWGPMASTIVFGLILSTVTALIVIPCLYGVFTDFFPKMKNHSVDAEGDEENWEEYPQA